jgi:hypothetical protein
MAADDAIRPIYQDRVLDEYDGADMPQFDIADKFLPLLNVVKQEGTHLTAGQLNNSLSPSNVIAFGETRTEYNFSDKKNIWMKIYSNELMEDGETYEDRVIYHVLREEMEKGKWRVEEKLYDKVLNTETGLIQNTLVQDRRMTIYKKGKSLEIVVLGSDVILISDEGITGGKIGTWPLPEIGAGAGESYYMTANGASSFTAFHEDVDEYELGVVYFVTFEGANTGPAMIKINELAELPILADGNIQLKAGDIAANSTHCLVYDGTRMKLISQRAVLSAAQLNSQILGYQTLSDTPVTSGNTLLTALGYLQGQINNRSTPNQVSTAISNALSNYVTFSQLSNTLSSYVTSSQLTTAIGNYLNNYAYATQSWVNSAISNATRNFITSSALSGYVTTNTYNNGISDLQRQINALAGAGAPSALKSIQSGTISGSGTSNLTVYISSVNVSKSILSVSGYGTLPAGSGMNGSIPLMATLYGSYINVYLPLLPAGVGGNYTVAEFY